MRANRRGCVGARALPAGRRAFALVEICVAIMLLGLVLATVSLLMVQYQRATEAYLCRRQLQMAAESQVERMRAGLLKVEDARFVDEAGVSYEIDVEPAEAPWAPLVHVSVEAEVVGRHLREYHYTLRAYVNPTEQ